MDHKYIIYRKSERYVISICNHYSLIRTYDGCGDKRWLVDKYYLRGELGIRCGCDRSSYIISEKHKEHFGYGNKDIISDKELDIRRCSVCLHEKLEYNGWEYYKDEEEGCNDRVIMGILK